MPKITLTPDQQKKLLIGILTTAALTVWLLMVLLPQQRGLGEARAQRRLLQDQLQQLKTGLMNLPAMEEEITRLSSGEAHLPAHAKPPEEQLPDLLEEITKAAKKAQVQVVGQKPESDLDALAAGPSGYLEVPIVVMLTGSYHQIGQFLDLLENSENLLRVRELSIRSGEDPYRHQGIVLFHAYLLPAAGRSDANS